VQEPQSLPGWRKGRRRSRGVRDGARAGRAFLAPPPRMGLSSFWIAPEKSGEFFSKAKASKSFGKAEFLQNLARVSGETWRTPQFTGSEGVPPDEAAGLPAEKDGAVSWCRADSSRGCRWCS
jgi:hypothetical protein